MPATRSTRSKTTPAQPPIPAVQKSKTTQPQKKGQMPTKESIESNIPLPSQPGMVTTQPPKKRGRKPKVTASDAETEPPPKKAKSSTAKAPLPSREALPARNVRNNHPAIKANVVPPTRRTSKQVAAECDAILKAAEEDVERGKAAMTLLALMQVDEEVFDKEMEVDNPHRLSAVAGVPTRVDSRDDEGKSFESISSDLDSESNKATPEVVKKIGKQCRGRQATVQADIDAMADRIRGRNGQERLGVNATRKRVDYESRFSRADALPKKYTNSGLRLDSSRHETEDNARIGSLNDNDAHATRPNYTRRKAVQAPAVQYPAQLRRDPTRKNEMVDMSLDSDGEPCVNVKGSKTRNAKPKVPKKMGQPGVGLNASLKWTRDPQWAAAFIPSLTQVLYTSRKPFEDFKRDSVAFLDAVQETFDASFPHIEYTLQSSDTLVSEACKRLNTRRSKIASDVLEEVKQFFKHCDFADKPESIKDYSLWAVRYDGPGFYQGPTPRQCTYPRGHANYIKPTGAFQSHFIINVAKKFLRYAEKSLLEPKIDAKLNPPVGLFGMLLLSVERAFTAYLATGSFVSPPDFTHDRYWRELDVYIRQVARLHEHSWNEILHAASEEDRKPNKIANASTISAFRENLYIPSSPEKPY